MKNIRFALQVVLVAGVLALAMACTPGEATPTPSEGGGILNTGGGLGGSTTSAPEVLASSGGALSYPASGGQQTGIYVTGVGTVKVVPDLVRLSLGVETEAKTVTAATREAATAMSNIVRVLKAAGLADKDIQTRYFSIQPQYTYFQAPVLTGYRVTNSVTALVRNLEKVGELVDAVTEAGGDATRISGITFTVEKPEQYQDQAREAAVLQAVAVAGQFARLTGVTLGRPLYLSELGAPSVQDFGVRALSAEAAPSSTTPIQTGELDVVVQIQAVFDIVS